MSSASAGDPLGYLKKQVEDLSDTLKAKNVVLDALMIKSEGKETEGTKKIEGIIADIKKELKEVEEKIAKERKEEQKQGTFVVVVVVLFFGADLRVIVRVVLSKPCLRWVRFDRPRVLRPPHRV